MSAEEFSEQLEEILSQIQKILEKELPSLKGSARLEKCSYLRNRVQRAKTLLRSLTLEVRDMADADSYTIAIAQYDQDIKKYLADITWAETSSEKGHGAAGIAFL